jgi:dTDP-4-dehydrorhamnose reductase
MTVTVLGSRGMLGSDLVPALTGAGYRVIGLDLPEFDITNPNHQLEMVADTDVVINCAAYTDVDGAETNKDRAWSVNKIAIEGLAELVRSDYKYLIHISTDFVFNGIQIWPYRESDTAYPVNVYGQSKLSGEQALLKSACRCAIVRLQWTYGRHGKNFVSKILDLAKTNKRIDVVDDQMGSPTPTADAASAIVQVLEQGLRGIYHYSNMFYTSRAGAAQVIVDTMNLDTVINPVPTTPVPGKARRPLNSRFNCAKIDGLGIKRRCWKMGLQEFLLK